jgi:hypothetical protein
MVVYKTRSRCLDLCGSGIFWYMLFADDVVLVDESRTGLIRSWSYGDELWRQKVLGLVSLKRSI